MLYPAMVFAFNRQSNVSSFNRSMILDRLEGHVILETFRDSLIRNLELKENIQRKNVTPSTSLIQQQKEEMEYLERLEEERKAKELEEKLKKQKELEDKKRKELEIEMLKLEKQKILPPEPEEGNIEAAFIIFRYPDGDRRAQRRFLKTDKIKVNIILNY